MTKGEAINWLINISADIGKQEHKGLWHYEQALFEIREMLEAQPEQECEKCIFRPFKQFQPEPHWIPCSERLPDKNGRYLCTNSRWGTYEVDLNIWYCKPEPSWLWEQGVTAWMPLPEPYKEGDE